MKQKRLTTRIAAAVLALAGLSALLAQGGGFQFRGLLSRVITPNGDGINDFAIFCFDNFSDSDVSGKIYTLYGAEVADMTRQDPALAGCPAGNRPQSMSWDARSNGAIVHGGIYIYQIKSEGLVFTGSLAVVR